MSHDEGQDSAACSNNPLVLHFHFHFRCLSQLLLKVKVKVFHSHRRGREVNFSGMCSSTSAIVSTGTLVSGGMFVSVVSLLAPDSVGRRCQSRLFKIPLNTCVSTLSNVVKVTPGDKVAVTKIWNDDNNTLATLDLTHVHFGQNAFNSVQEKLLDSYFSYSTV